MPTARETAQNYEVHEVDIGEAFTSSNIADIVTKIQDEMANVNQKTVILIVKNEAKFGPDTWRLHVGHVA